MREHTLRLFSTRAIYKPILEAAVGWRRGVSAEIGIRHLGFKLALRTNGATQPCRQVLHRCYESLDPPEQQHSTDDRSIDKPVSILAHGKRGFELLSEQTNRIVVVVLQPRTTSKRMFCRVRGFKHR